MPARGGSSVCPLAQSAQLVPSSGFSTHARASPINTDARSLEGSLGGARFSASATAVPSRSSLSITRTAAVIVWNALRLFVFFSYFYMFRFYKRNRKKNKIRDFFCTC